MIRPASMLLALALLSSLSLRAADLDPKICNAALSNIKDNFNLESESEVFSQTQNTLREFHAQTLDEYHAKATSVGIPIPVADDIINLKYGDSSNSSSFKQNYDDFVNSSYANYTSRARFSSARSEVNQFLAAQWTKCYELVLSAMNGNATVIAATPSGGFADFLIDVHTRMPMAQKVTINDVEPAKLLSCTYKGLPFTFGVEVPDNDFNLVCTKDPTKSFSIVVTTNAGKSQQVKLPSQISKIEELSNQLVNLQGTVDRQVATLRADLSKAQQDLASATASLSLLRAWQGSGENGSAQVLKLGPGGNVGIGAEYPVVVTTTPKNAVCPAHEVMIGFGLWLDGLGHRYNIICAPTYFADTDQNIVRKP